MVKTPKIIEPIDADFDDLAGKILATKKISQSPSKKAEYSGSLEIGDVKLNCYVTKDGERFISGRSMTGAIGMKGRGQGMARISSNSTLKPFMNNDLVLAIDNPVSITGKTPIPVHGYQAEILADICDVLLEARKSGALKTEQEIRYSDFAEILVRGFARVGIIALVDEATGYQEVRAKEALAEIFSKFLSDERQKWTTTFPLDFYEEIYRLRGWEFKPWSTKRPSVVANWTENFVYDRLAPKITEELKKKNPKPEKGRRKNKHFQWLSPEHGHPRLKEHLSGVIALLRASETWDQFLVSLDRAYPKFGNTIEMPLTGGGNKD